MQKIYTDLTSIREDLQEHQDRLSDNLIDQLVYTANLSDDSSIKKAASEAILSYSSKHGVHSSSLQALYEYQAQQSKPTFTVPALNIRTLTYDIAQALFTYAQEHKVGPMIFEIAVSEQGYTSQPPLEYATSILGGAMKAHYSGPVFLLGDHYQLHSKDFHADKEAELSRLKKLIKESIKAHFYNIDIDGSTLVDYGPDKEIIQQKDNYEATAYLTEFIRKNQPENTTIGIGGEIGHIGGKNSTREELHAFMRGYSRMISPSTKGINKIAIQTGTQHGGKPASDGSVSTMDFEAHLHKDIGEIARSKYGLGGTVQHGASTLPVDQLHILPDMQALEVHLATGWQNIVYENLDPTLREKMYDWIKNTLQDERKTEWTDEQFVYKLRKKAFGEFKKQMWSLPEDQKEAIIEALVEKFNKTCEQLNVKNTQSLIEKLYNNG